MKYDKYFVLNCGKYFSASYITILTRIQAINSKYKNLAGSLTTRLLEMDELWGRVCCKKTLCWLWYAINHDSGGIVVCVFGARKSEVLKVFGFC
ncbi:MAG: hypothetical protein LBH62_01655 [Nitrososphaerota archaeon]|jgi:hypothetical protein|nr:hypothetical protein [Nitrososphaerota archaeon]